MIKLFYYQIFDSLSEKIISTFTGPSNRFAENVFYNFVTSDKMNGSDLSDIFLVKCRNGFEFDSYSDYQQEFSESEGDEFVVYANDLILERKKNES